MISLVLNGFMDEMEKIAAPIRVTKSHIDYLKNIGAWGSKAKKVVPKVRNQGVSQHGLNAVREAMAKNPLR